MLEPAVGPLVKGVVRPGALAPADAHEPEGQDRHLDGVQRRQAPAQHLGFAGETEGGMGWDVGLVWYTYPDSSASLTASSISDYPELYAGMTFGPVEIKQWFTNDYSGTDLDALYTEMNYGFELPADFGLNLHLGYNYGDAFDGFENFLHWLAGANDVGEVVAAA